MSNQSGENELPPHKAAGRYRILAAPALLSLTHPAAGGGAFVSRAGQKIEAALMAFALDVRGRVCADLGANVGGFTDCLLRYGAARVYAVDTAYGVLAWTLRKDARVIVKDRTNAMHARLAEPVGLVAVDVGWTRQERVLPAVMKLVEGYEAGGRGERGGGVGGGGAGGGDVLTLIKPHYESDLARTQRGVLTAAQSEEVLFGVMDRIAAALWQVKGIVQSPLEGQKGNVEYVAWLRRP